MVLFALNYLHIPPFKVRLNLSIKEALRLLTIVKCIIPSFFIKVSKLLLKNLSPHWFVVLQATDFPQKLIQRS